MQSPPPNAEPENLPTLQAEPTSPSGIILLCDASLIRSFGSVVTTDYKHAMPLALNSGTVGKKAGWTQFHDRNKVAFMKSNERQKLGLPSC